MQGCLVFVLLLVAIPALIVAILARSRAGALAEEIQALRGAVDYLTRQVRELRTEAPPEAAPAAKPQPTAPITASAEAPIAPSAVSPQPVVSPPPVVIADEALPAGASLSVAAASTDATPTPPITGAPPEPVVTAPPAATIPPVPTAEPPHAAAPPPDRPAQPPPRPPAPPKPPSKPFDWESLVGIKLFSGIAGVALVLAALFFLKYSVEHGWLSPTIRATIGLLTGITLLVVCELRVARGYKFTANALHGAGIAILYATLFAIHALWHLLPAGVVFLLMLIVTAVAVMLSIRRDSVFIALLGLLGGFATPALLSTGENKPIGLFSYLLILNAGLAWTGYKKRWPVLTVCSLVLTAIYQWAWIGKFLTASQLPLAAGIFLVFAIVAVSALWVGRKEGDRSQPFFDRVALAGAALPLLFAVFAAAVPAYGARFNILFGFLLLVDVGLAAIAITRGHRWLHLLGAVATLLAFAIWSGASYRHEAWPVVLVWLTAFVAVYLIAERFVRTRAVYVAPLLLFMFPLLISIESATASPAVIFGFLFVQLAAIALYALIAQRGLVYFVAAFFAIIAEGFWSARFLTNERLIAGLALYGVFALFFLGVPALARRFQRRLEPANGIAVVLLLSIGVLFFLAGGSVANAALWGIALLLAIVNVGALIEARAVAHPILAALAMLLSWIVIAVWWATSTISIHIIPAMMVVGGFALIVVAGNLWAGRGRKSEFDTGTYLALAGHLFLLFVASQKSLSIPPWPLLAVLGVLDLAIAVAALYLRRNSLLTAAMGASQLVLMIWSGNAEVAPWPYVALISALTVAALALVWFAIDRRFAGSAVVAIFLGEIVAMIVGGSASIPVIGWLIVTQLLFAIAILVVAAVIEQHALAVIAVAFTALSVGLAKTTTPGEMFGFALAMYAPFLLYPLVLGGRVKRSLYPYLAAVLAGVPFFFFARHAMLEAGYDWVIGALPVAQAILMLVLVWRLLRIETAGNRLLSRLALVSAAALAFLTVAIPLQLDKQWITIGWALEGAALVWLFTRIPHRGLLAWAGALLAAVVVRLTLNPAVLAYHPRSAAPIVNWYLYSYLVCAVALFVAAWILPKSERERWPFALPALNSGGTLLLFFLLNIEIADFYSRGPNLTFNFFSSSLAQDLTYTIGWATFALAMLIAGIIMHTRAARVAALILLLVTILKCFLHDLGRLGGLYRVGSLLGLAISLVIVGILLQRFVMVREPAEGG
jgi:uncharacterized membrane protein